MRLLRAELEAERAAKAFARAALREAKLRARRARRQIAALERREPRPAAALRELINGFAGGLRTPRRAPL